MAANLSRISIWPIVWGLNRRLKAISSFRMPMFLGLSNWMKDGVGNLGISVDTLGFESE